MQFLKAFGLLLLLIWGSTDPAFATPSVEDQFKENQLASQVSEYFGELPFSTLTNTSFDSARSFYGGSDQYIFNSLYETREAEKYLHSSRSIDPGLDVPEIIFPIHTFL